MPSQTDQLIINTEEQTKYAPLKELEKKKYNQVEMKDLNDCSEDMDSAIKISSLNFTSDRLLEEIIHLEISEKTKEVIHINLTVKSWILFF